MLTRAHQYDGDRDVLLGERRGFEAHECREMLEPILLSAVVERRCVATQVRGDLRLRETQHAFDGRERQRVKLFACAHDQRMTDRQRKRQPDREDSAFTGFRLHVERTAEAFDFSRNDVHANATARLLRDRSGGGESGLQDQLHRVFVAQDLSLRDQTERRTLGANRVEVHAGAVIAQAHHHFGALAVKFEDDSTGLRLVLTEAVLRLLDSVHHRISQHVLERRQHSLENLPIEFTRGALDHQFRALACLGSGLTNDACQPLHVPLERHHPSTHETVLQLGNRSSLLLKKVLRVFREIFQQLLNASDVVRGFRQRSGELLNRRVTVELERVKITAMSALIFVAVQNLRFSLDFEAAQLFLQTRHRA